MGIAEIRAIKAGLHKAARDETKQEKKKVGIPKVGEKKKSEGKIRKINPRSKKQSKVMGVLEMLYKSFLADHDECEIKSPACTGQAETVHHAKGRGINVVFLQKYWKRSCAACNLYVENKDQWAQDNGHKISRHTKNQNKI